MIEIVREPEVNPIFVPVPSGEFARRKRRLIAAFVAGAVVIATAAGVIYKGVVDPIYAKESYDAGERLYKAARYPEAILSLDRAIDLKPHFADAYFVRAQARVAEEDTERAIQDFTKVIELQPSDTRGFLGRASVYLDRKDFASAIADCNAAIALDPKLAPAYNLRGMAVRSAGDPRKALEDLNRAVELGPEVDTYYQRGATYQILGEHRLAIPDFDQVVAAHPDLASGYYARSGSRRAIGDQQGADADLRRGRLLDGSERP